MGSCSSSAVNVAQEAEEVKFERQVRTGPVFVSVQVNKCTEELLKEMSDGHDIDMKASMPRFNSKGTGRLPGCAEQFDVPGFGLRVTDAILELFTVRGMDTTAKQLDWRVPERRLNLVVKEKFSNKYSQKLIAAVEGSAPQDATRLRDHQAATQRLKDFARELGQLSPDTEHARSLSAWRVFVQRFLVNESWEDMLHNKEVLRNFGFEADVAEGLLEENALPLNWLSKALTCFSLPGSMADVVNLAFAMTNTKAPAGVAVAEDQIIAVLARLRKYIENGDRALWTPTVFIQDAELDDMACWLLLQHVSSQQGKKLDVYVQLPQLEASDSRARALNAVHSRYQPKCAQVFRDPDSSNTDPILAISS